MAVCRHRVPVSDRNRDVIEEVKAAYGYTSLDKALTHIVDIYLKYKDVEDTEKEVKVEVVSEEETKWDHRAYLNSIALDTNKPMKIVHLN